MTTRPMSVKQFAQFLSVTPDTVRKWCRNGTLPDRRIPGTRKYLLYRDDVERYRTPSAQSDLQAA